MKRGSEIVTNRLPSHKNIVPEQKAHAVSVHAKIAFFAHSLTRLINTRIGRDSKLQTR